MPFAVMESPFVDRLYDETLTLLENARDYAAWDESLDRGLLVTEDSYRLTVESMRTTARLVSVMAWVLARKAVQACEIAPECADPLAPAGGYDLSTLEPDRRLPRRFFRIATKAQHLYIRVHRLDGVRM